MLWLSVVVVVVAVLLVRELWGRREARLMSVADQERLRDVQRRIRKSPVRYVFAPLGPILVLAVQAESWKFWVVTVLVVVGALVAIDRNRRNVLREEGFSLTWWGDPDYSKGTSR